MKKLIIISILMVLMASGAIRGQQVEYVGSTLWSSSYDVEVAGSYAYCAFTNGLMIFDISDPANPDPAGQLFLQQEAFQNRSTGIRGSYAFIANRESALVVVDVGDPAAPFVIAEIELPDDIRDLQILGNYIYIADNESGLQIISIENPEEPAVIGNIFSGIAARSIFVEGNYAYIAGGWYGGEVFHIIDISDPTNPVLVGECPDYSTALDIHVSGDFAYLACYDDGLRVYDVTDRSQPQFIGDLEFYIYALNVVVEGNYAYVAGAGYYNPYLDVVNISDPANPTFMGSIMLHGAIENLHVSGTYVYVVSVGAYGESRFDIIDVSDPDNPVRPGFYDTSHSLSRFDLSGDYALITDPYIGVKIIDLTDLSSPSLVGILEAYPGCSDISIQENYAFLSGGEILDITDPLEPLLIGDCDAYGNIHVQDTVAFFASGNNLQIVNVSDLEEPELIYSLDMGDFAKDVFVEGQYAFVACGGSGLKIVDISNLAYPVIRGHLDLSNGAMGVYVHESYCYVNFYNYNSPRWGKLFIINVSNPDSPFLAGQYETSSDLWAVAVQGNYAYMAVGEIGLEILDITDLADPSSVLLFNTSGYAQDIKLVDNYIYLSNWNSFMILHFDPQTGIIKEISELPIQFSLSQNHPNPFNATTTIRYDLPTDSDMMLEIYDLLGRKVETLINGQQPAGSHSIVWDAERVSSGIYFYRIQAGEYVESRSCLLLK